MQKTLGIITIIFAAFLSSVFIYLLMGYFLRLNGWKAVAGQLGLILPVTFGLIAIVIVAVAIKLKQSSFDERIAPFPNMEALHSYAVSKSVIVFAMSEVPAILGIMCYLLTGNLTGFVALCGLSILAFLIVRPTLSNLESLKHG